MVLPVFVVVVLFVALLVSYPWYVLTIGIAALSSRALPLGWMSYRQYLRKDAEAAAAKAAHAAAQRSRRGGGVSSGAPTAASPMRKSDRNRLN